MPRHSALTAPLHDTHVPNKLIVRFKPSVVQHLAATPAPRSARTRALAASMPDEVAGPLDMLKREAGLQVIKPLFTTKPKAVKTRAGVPALTAVRGALETSATDAPRESLRGFQLIELKGKRLDAGLLKSLRASKAVEFVEPVPNRWLTAKRDPLVNRQWGLRATRWFDGNHPSAAKVHVAVLDSGVDEGHEDLQAAIEEYRHDNNAARDFLGHGTHVSGIIAAASNNSVGITGVANCRLHCWKIFDDPEGKKDEQNFNFEFYSAALASALDSESRSSI